MRPTAVGLLVAALGVVGCAAHVPSPGPDATPSAWAPLAVYRASLGMDGLAQGTLVLTDTCVFIEDASGARELVVWKLAPDLWSWDPTSREIISTWGSRTGRYGDGDEIRLGGGGRTGDHGPAIEQILREQEWLSPPDPSCITPRVFFASGEISDPER